MKRSFVMLCSQNTEIHEQQQMCVVCFFPRFVTHTRERPQIVCKYFIQAIETEK